MWRICTRALAAAQPDNLFSICFRVTCCHKVTHFSTDLPQLSTYVIYYLNKVLRCEGRVVRSVNFLLTDTVWVCAGSVEGDVCIPMVCAGGVEGDVCIPMGVR